MTQDRAVRTSLVLCAMVLIFAAAYFARAILAPVAFALFIVAVVWPLQQRLQTRIPKLLALVVTILAILAAIAVLLYLLVWGLGLVAQWVLNNTDRFQTVYALGYAWLAEHGISVSTLMADHYDPRWIVGVVRELGSRTYGLISFAVLAFAFTVLGLLEVDPMRANIERLGDQDLSRSLLKACENIAVKFRKNMLVRTVMSVVTGLVVFVFALFAGIELATAWGVIAFVFNYIPFIGPLFATIFPTLFALVQFESWQLAVVVFLSLNVIQFVTGSYIEPRIAGAALSISPFMVLFAVFFWSFLWGIPGAFIGVPIMIAALAVCEQHESTQWIVRLLSGRTREPA